MLSMRQALMNESDQISIDFDEASNAWRQNKNKLKNGMFSYKKSSKNCCYVCEDGKKCRKKQLLNDDFCQWHFSPN